jgi:DNA mismatch repair ATPase MutS
MYSFGFNGYVDCVEGLVFNIKNGHINFCEFIDNSKKMVFKNSYHASLKNDKHVKNTIKFNKNMILSGPNASGKTTLLKNTLINIICSQQFGCGFYEDAKVHPFKYLHCYLNIPDTSGRDSLFQAEARRCKEILDTIDANKEDTHFCAFDEIYSGTNPEEAVATAASFLTYLNKNKNVSYILTTHFLKVCKKLKNNKNILNCNMHTIAYANDVKYTYSLKKGISKIKGGVNVLKQLNYPSEIIQNAI